LLVEQYLRRIDPLIFIESVGSPSEAFKMLQEKQYDCVISDYVMPEIDGVTFAIKVREQFDLPFLLYTGQGSEEIASTAFTAGIDDYLRKEFDSSHFQVLARRVRMAVEKHKAEEALRLREEQYRSIVTTSPDAITLTDLKGKIIATNRQAAVLHGFEDEEDLIESVKDAFELIAPEDRQRAYENLMETLRNGSVSNVEYKLLRKDGTFFPAEVNASVILGENDEPYAFIAVVRDITARYQYRQRLEVLYEHTSNLRSATSIEDVAALTFDAIEQVLGFHLGNFSMVENSYLREIHTRGLELDSDFLLPLDGEGITVRAVRLGETQRVQDVRLDDDYVPGPVEDIYTPLSELAVPVKINDRAVAVINVENENLNAFSEDDQKLIEILAGYVASTISNIWLLDSERSYKAKIEALHSSATSLMGAKNFEEIVDLSLEIIQGVLGFHWGGIGKIQEGGIRYVKTIGKEIPSGTIIPLDGPGITVRAINTGRSQLVPDTRLDPAYVRLSIPESGAKQNLSELTVPIIVKNRIEGIINLENEEPNAFSEDDQRLLEILAQHIGSAMGRLDEIESLRNSEQKFKGFLEASMDAVLVNVGTKIEYVNQKLLELLGFDRPSDIIGRDITELFPPELEGDIRNRTLRRQRGEDEPEKYETVFLRKDGTLLDVESVLSVIDYDGHPATLAFARDITERKHFENKLDALHRHAVDLAKAETEEEIAESTLNAIEKILGFTYVSFAVVEGDALVFRYFRGNSTVMRLPLDGSGLTVRAINSKEIQHVPDTRGSEFYISSRFAGEPESLSELDVPIFVDGQAVALINIESERLNAFSDNDRNLVETLSMHVSSAFHRLGEVNRLEAQVEEKTRELLEAERVVAAGRIASMVGHDLRGPLQTISMALELLKEDPEDRREIIELCEKSLQRAVEMLEEIWSHIRDTPPEIVRTDLVELVGRVLNEKIFPRTVEVSSAFQEEVLFVELDPMKIYRVLDNIIQNAIEAMPHRGQLRVKVSRDGESAVVEVMDSGGGIEDEIVQNLFRLFVTTKRSGTGLGLAFCKRAVEAHGGNISVETKVGEGTTFKIRLPLHGAPDPVTPGKEEMSITSQTRN